MNGGEFIERFRQDMTDEETPPLWSDALILRYLTDTQEDFCRLTEGIPDSMSSICRVTAAASKGIVRLSRKIKKIRAATLESTGTPIDVTSVEDARRIVECGTLVIIEQRPELRGLLAQSRDDALYRGLLPAQPLGVPGALHQLLRQCVHGGSGILSATTAGCCRR